MPRVPAMLLPLLAMLWEGGTLPEDVPEPCADGEECELHLLQSAALKVTSEVDAESGDKTRGPVELVKSRGIGQRLEKLLMKTISDCYVPSFHPGATFRTSRQVGEVHPKDSQ